MSDRYLHIISFDVPYPPDYGGIIDVYYKAVALRNAGVKVILHAFHYGRDRNDSLMEVCHKVFYYQRNMSKKLFFGRKPFIIASRESESLCQRLLEDEYPILIEGMHGCFFLSDHRFKDRIIAVRTHNIEHDYYASLGRVEKNLFKKMYFHIESVKLKMFEEHLRNSDILFSISPLDTEHYSKLMGNTHYLPPFHPFEKSKHEGGLGEFVLYHGNLAVGENNEAALFLVNEVFKYLDTPCVIAGSNPSKELKFAVRGKSNIILKPDISTEEIHELIRHAHINILPTFQSTGMKLKLLSVLFNGRHCIVNDAMVLDTGLERLCTICNTGEEMVKTVQHLLQSALGDEEVQCRKEILDVSFSNARNAEMLIHQIFGVH
jgi:hypothetical protein